MNIERFTGPGSTPSRRRFWDDAMSVVHASRKLPGTNVKVLEDPTGSVISVPDSRKKGGGAACNCPLPDEDCPHSIGISIKFDDTDIDEDDFLEFTDSINTGGIAIYKFDNGDGTHTIEVYGWHFTGTEFSDFVIPDASFFNVYHNICITLNRVDDATVNVAITVDGSSDSFTMDTPAHPTDTLRIGSISPSGGVHRTISCVKLLANPDNTEEDFSFPADSFDSLIGGASIVDGALRIDEDDNEDSYGLKTMVPAYNLACAFVCGGNPIQLQFTGDINGTCDSGIVITTVNPQSFDGSVTPTAGTVIDTATLCSASTDSTAGRLHWACGATTDEQDFTFAYGIGIVTTAGSIYGTSFSVGDWVFLTGPFGIYPGGPLGGCGPCNASGHAANLILPDVLNTISITEFGVTQVINVTFSF